MAGDAGGDSLDLTGTEMDAGAVFKCEIHLVPRFCYQFPGWGCFPSCRKLLTRDSCKLPVMLPGADLTISLYSLYLSVINRLKQPIIAYFSG